MEFELGACPTLGCNEALPAALPSIEVSAAPIEAARPVLPAAPIQAARLAGPAAPSEAERLGPEETPRHAVWRLVQWVLVSAVVPLLAWAYYTHGYEGYCDHVLHRHYRLVRPGEFGFHAILPAVLAELGSLLGVAVSLVLLRGCWNRRAGEGETNSEEARHNVFGVCGLLVAYWLFIPSFVAWVATACCQHM